MERQERIARATAERLGLDVVAVFVDNNRSAWKRSRKRAGWDEMLAAAQAGTVRHIVAYHPDRLMRQPKDLEALLDAADDHGIVVHGEANRRDLADPDDRFFLRLEVAHACKSSDDTSRRSADAMADRAYDGKPHAGPRPLGYSKDGMKIIDGEAVTVRRVFERFQSGDSPNRIASGLNADGLTTVTGKPFTPQTVSNMLRIARYAGILTFQGEAIGQGIWPPIVDLATWQAVQERRVLRSAEWQATPRAPRRFYLLRGLVICGKCGTHMSGTGGAKPKYGCARHQRRDGLKCARAILAAETERFVEEAAVRMLTDLDVSGRKSAALALSHKAETAINEATAELDKIRAAWKARDLPTDEYLTMRRELDGRMKAARGKVTRRPAIAVLEGATGPGAAANWAGMRERGEYERMNAILRFLFVAVRIAEATAARTFDYGRIDIEPADL